VAISTDSFVISPLFFPGGDIGSLAVHGTVNDLAMCGARPLALTAALILEEGLPMEQLWQVIRSMQLASQAVGVSVITGDTKVVDRGKGDGVFINTTGIGLIPAGVQVAPTRARSGDVVLISGQVAVHGIAIMSVREGLEFETALESDSAPLHAIVASVLDRAGDAVHVLRDPTRGGVASALNEIAAAARVGIRLEENRIPIQDEVRGACEILGLDPLYVANEGRFVAFISARDLQRALDLLHGHPLCAESKFIGTVSAGAPGLVTLKNRLGIARVLDLLSGEQLPRIC
jgi:hydrogenase expression/formation protein HypE